MSSDLPSDEVVVVLYGESGHVTVADPLIPVRH